MRFSPSSEKVVPAETKQDGDKVVKTLKVPAEKEKGKRGRPRNSAKSPVDIKGQKQIKSFFSPPTSQVQDVTDNVGVLEYKYMHVDGLSRTEARHLAAAMKASLGGGDKVEADVSVKVKGEAALKVEGEGQVLAHGEVCERAVAGGDEEFPEMLVEPYALSIPPEYLSILRDMWCREGVVLNGGVGALDGLQLKHTDLARLLTVQDSVQGWLNDTCMDWIGRLVNGMGVGAYAFSTYLRECFLLGNEKGGRAIRKVIKKAWTRDTEEGVRGVVVPDMWLFPMTKKGDPHWWLLLADVDEMSYYVLDPFSPNTEAPVGRVSAARELLSWVLGAVYQKNQKTIDQFDYYPSYMYKLPVQRDSFNCGVYVGLYMVMLARNLIQYEWPEDMQQYRYKLAVALERNDVYLFLDMPEECKTLYVD